MDPDSMSSSASPPLRRSKRRPSGMEWDSGKQVPSPAVKYKPTPRSPLKRTRRKLEHPSAAVVNGSKDLENESPTKHRRLDSGGADGDMVNEIEMVIQESPEEEQKTRDHEMEIAEEHKMDINVPKICKDVLADVNLFPRVVLGQRCQPRGFSGDNPISVTKETASTKLPPSPVKTSLQAPRNTSVTTMDQYKKTMEAKVKSIDKPRVDRFVPIKYPSLEKAGLVRHRIHTVPAKKESTYVKNEERKKKTAGAKKGSSSNSKNSNRGATWYLGPLVFLLLLSSATLLAFKVIPNLQSGANSEGAPPKHEGAERFVNQLSLLETQFPSQRPKFWKWSKIHLEKHLKTAQPSGPVSLILTAGRGAERTMQCLAKGLASSFSSALNASFVVIDGASRAEQDSDEVKMSIDNQLRVAFEGHQPVAVIHRFEELPPGSTLIFYRYCDHENAAYKRVFLLFTVLLPQQEISSDLSVKEVEETVQNYVQGKLVRASNGTSYNDMDVDKFGGLWSRISHLILPVVSEEAAEKQGCP